MSTSGLCIQRMSNGQISATLSNMRGENIGMVGAFEGNAQIVIGNTSSGNGTELYIVGESGTEINVTDASKNLSFWGNGLDVDVNDQDNESNIQWNASNGSLSYENTSRAAQLEITSGAQNNEFTFGWGDAEIVDSGQYNAFQLGSGTSYYASTQSNVGAFVIGGAGRASYQISGNYGVFAQGSGIATYQINSDADGKAGSYGDKNAIISNGVSAIVDNGSRSYIYQSNENSTLTENGYRSLAQVADESTVTMGEDSYHSFIFSGGATSMKKDVDGDGVEDEFNLGALLYDQGWSNNWNNQDNYYMTTSGHKNHITGNWLTLSGVLDNVLKLGDEGAEIREENK